MTSLTVLVPVLVTGTVIVDGWSAVTVTALSGAPALVPSTVGVPMVRWHEHPVSAGADVAGLVVVALTVLSPLADVAGVDVAGNVLATLVAPLRARPPVIAEVAAVSGLDETDRVVDPLPADVAELVESVPVVVADAEVVPLDAAFCGCTSPDTSDVTVVSGLVSAVVWLLVRGGSVVSSAWATPTPRSVKPPASNPACMDRFTQVRMRNLSKLCWGRSVISVVSGRRQPISVSACSRR
ncbi:hypothetical protein [Amycolatopsis sp. NPDC102389]|uniref:hypothetical protein n=1 Tax=Amycolatopsis sp. NPDC102389 TaxID=3363941 RepID=UPI00381A2EB8